MESTSRPSSSSTEGHLGLHPLGTDVLHDVPAISIDQIVLALGWGGAGSQAPESEFLPKEFLAERDWLW